MMVWYDAHGNMQPMSLPVKVTRKGDVEIISPRHNEPINATLYRKSPLLDYAWIKAVKIENGKFEASNDADFNKATTVGVVSTSADKAGEINIAPNTGKYRYWRYIQHGESAQCYIGEITLYSHNKIVNREGKVIGTHNPKSDDIFTHGDRAFDGDVLTAFSITRSGEAWIGLDFGKPIEINKIQYAPRSDGNMIEPGDKYELMYWDNGQWCSLGTKIAETTSLRYNNIPSGALYVLHNRTKGNSVRIFLINSAGGQEWW